jgi:hypothetical protein
MVAALPRIDTTTFHTRISFNLATYTKGFFAAASPKYAKEAI